MEKIKADMCWEFDIIKTTIQTTWKTEPKLLVCLNGKDWEQNDFKSLKKSDICEVPLKLFQQQRNEIFQ